MKRLCFILFGLFSLSLAQAGDYRFEKSGTDGFSSEEITRLFQTSIEREGNLKRIFGQVAEEHNCHLLPDGQFFNCMITNSINEQNRVLTSWGQGSAEGLESYRAFFYLIPEGTGMLRQAVITVDFTIEIEHEEARSTLIFGQGSLFNQ